MRPLGMDLIRWFQWLANAVAVHKNVGAVLELLVDEVFPAIAVGEAAGRLLA